MAQRLEARTITALVVALLLWASAFAGIRAGLHSYGPGQVALLRFGTASLCLLVYALIVRMRMPAAEDLGRIIIAGLTGITLYHVALNFGERSVNASAAALLISTVPVFTAILSAALLGERLSGWGWGGIGIAFAGSALISLGTSAALEFDPNAMLILLASLASAIYFVLAKKPLTKYTALEFTTYAIIAGTIPMLVFVPGLIEQYPQAAVADTVACVYLGVFPGAIAYVLWSYALSKLSASVTATFLYFQPVNAAVIAWLWLGEVPTLMTVIGGAIAVVGVVLVQRKGSVRQA